MATIVELSRLIRDHGDDEEVWITHYSSNHQILLVGEGDFSFSCSLATRFRSASNICASSLDSYADDVVRKYKKGRSNLDTLKRLGASLLHGVDATKLQLHPHLNCRRFDRIIFNFPHAGFHGKETDSSLIKKHRELVFGFLHGASHMVRTNGEVHVSHKNKPPFCHWKLEELASKCSLALTQCVAFEKSEYPGYENKRGDGTRCDMPFLLGECTTFKFRVSRVAKEIYAEKLKGREKKERESKCPQALSDKVLAMYPCLAQKQLQGVSQRPVLSLGLSYHKDHNLRQVHDPLVQSRQLRALPLNPRGDCREHRCSHLEDAVASSFRVATRRPATFNHAWFQENSIQLDHPLRYTERSSHDFPFQPSHQHPQEERFFVECSSRFDVIPLDIYVRRMQSTLTQTSIPHLYCTEESPERRRQEPFFQRSNRLNGVSHEIYNGKGTSASFPGESQEGSLTRQSNLKIYPPRLWIVLKMDMSESEKSIKKAMKIASGASGVRSVSVQGQNDQLVIVGEGIDTAELTRELRKKVCHTTIVSVQAAPPPSPPQQQKQPPQPHLIEYHNEMAPARRCICEIPNLGYCGFCRSMRETPYQMVPSPYPPPVMYGGYRDDPDNCKIM
ncbi:hypothetical protein Bca101_058384 [Brassica carinata]